MRTRKLGRTGLRVSEVGFGAWAIGGTGYGPTDDRESNRALLHAFEKGINFFDTADTYGHGHSEKLIGEIFQKSSKRSQALIASKAGWDFYHGGDKKNFEADYIRFACGESLRRLKTDYIDLYQLHNPKLEAIQDGSVFKTLAELKKEGKIRFWGVSIHLPKEGVQTIQEGSSDTIQAVYNLIDQRIRRELIPVCEEHDIGLIAREPLYCGLLTGKYNQKSQFQKTDHRNRWDDERRAADFKKIDRLTQILQPKQLALKQSAIEFVLRENAVSVVIPGMKTIEQVEDHLCASNHPKVDDETFHELKQLFEQDETFHPPPL